MNREIVIVPEKKEKIEQIKKKYNNMKMSDETANKIQSLEVTNSILKAACIAVGVITAIDLFIPDPILGLDELALSAITTLLGTASSIVHNKIEALANDNNASLKMEEITNLSKQINDIASVISSKRNTFNR